MSHRWLTLFSVTFLAGVVFLLFALRLQPVRPPENDSATIVPGSVAAPSISFVNPKKGAQTPMVTIVEYGDFQCPGCKDLAETIDVVLRSEPDVQVVWKNMPNESVHELSAFAAIAAHCAGDQGKFWEYHDALFARQVYLSEEQFSQIANEIGLNTDAFGNRYQSRDPLPLVKQDLTEAIGLGLSGTPTLIIGEERLVGAISLERLLSVVNTTRAAAEEAAKTEL